MGTRQARLTTVRLTAADRARFDRDGFLLVAGALKATALDRLRAEANSLLNLALNVKAATAMDGGRLQAQWRGQTLLARILQPVNDVSATFSALAADPGIALALGFLMRAEPAFAHEKIVYKQAVPGGALLERSLFEDFPAGYSEAFVPHTDSGWYTVEDAYPESVVTLAIHLDDAKGRGPLSFLPGSHKETYPAFRGGDIDPALIRLERMTEVPARAGDAVIFHGRTVHASGRNDSDEPRRVFMATFCQAGDFHGDRDRRSRPRRRRAREMEDAYRRAVAGGTYADHDFLAGQVADGA